MPRAEYKLSFAGSGGDIDFPYYLSFYGLISQVLEHYAKKGISAKINFIFDDERAKSIGSSHIGKHSKARLRSARRDSIQDRPRFKNDESQVPLQAADMAAWWTQRKARTEQAGGKQIAMPWGSSLVQIVREWTAEGLDFHSPEDKPDQLYR